VSETPAALRSRIRKLDAELAARDRAERDETLRLKATVAVLAQHVQALTLDNDALRQALAVRGDIRTLRTQ
jgi:hypothetical protein